MKQIKEKDIYYHYAFEEILSDVICEIRDNIDNFDEDDVLKTEELDYDKEHDFIRGYSEFTYVFQPSEISKVANALSVGLERNKENIKECNAHMYGISVSEEGNQLFKKCDDGYALNFGLEIHKGDKDKLIRERISDVERQVPMDAFEAYRQDRLEEKKYGRRHY